MLFLGHFLIAGLPGKNSAAFYCRNVVAPINNTIVDLQFKIRGNRAIFDDIVFVFIGAGDEQTLGGWPITRDWYGLLAHKLRQAKVKAIAFDILFQKGNPRYREHDDFLASEFEAAGNICLAMTFGDLIPGNRELASPQNALYNGREPIYPLENFRQYAAATGFSNLGEGAILRKTPLAVLYNDSLRFSLGVQLAQLHSGSKTLPNFSREGLQLKSGQGITFTIPTDDRGQIRLNHVGNVEQVNSIGFVDLLQMLDTNPDSLNLEGKIVIVGATSPRLPIIKATPLSSLFPAALIHVTVAENIIRQNYLREVSVFLHLLLIAGMVILAAVIWQFKNRRVAALTGVVGLLSFLLAAFLFFKYGNLVLPVFYPTLAYIAAFVNLFLSGSRQALSEHAGITKLMKEQVAQKEAELKKAKENMASLQEELESRSTDSEAQRTLAEERQRSILQLESELRDLQGYLLPDDRQSSRDTISGAAFEDIIHAPNSKLKNILELINRIRADDIPVLIVGETGTGKEMIASAIHQTSQRKDKPFVAINCGALPETLLESELFGHEKGSFTGAQARRRGRFELADGGTIFLDEITETTPAFQARLLRVLQEGTFERVGSEQTMTVDVRVIAACNRDLQAQIEKGSSGFRPDLYYRLNGFPLKLPSLSQRNEDIALLSAHFLKKHKYESIKTLSDEAVSALQCYHWPGNVRELENVIRRAAILAQSENREMIRLNDLPPEILRSSQPASTDVAYIPLETQILEILRSYKFSRSAISQTARELGNRDRGTITEYFRGICFEELVKANYDLEAAAGNIAASSDSEVIDRVKKKIEGYIKNLTSLQETSADENDHTETNSAFKGLPKKYHPYLLKVLENLGGEIK